MSDKVRELLEKKLWMVYHLHELERQLFGARAEDLEIGWGEMNRHKQVCENMIQALLSDRDFRDAFDDGFFDDHDPDKPTDGQSQLDLGPQN